MSPRARFRAAWPAVLWTALVLVLLWLPGGVAASSTSWFPVALPAATDKAVHTALFAGETFFLEGLGRGRWWSRPILVAVVAALALAALTELVQRWVPERTSNLGDLLANGLGVALGAGVAGLRRRRGLDLTPTPDPSLEATLR